MQITSFLKEITNLDVFLRKILECAKKYNLSRSFAEDVVPKELKNEHKKTYYAKYNKTGYNKLKRDFNKDNTKKIILLYILIIYGFNRMLRFNSNGEFNIPVGNVDFNMNVKAAISDYIDFVKGKDIVIKSQDYKTFIDERDFSKNDFVYLDPPYLIAFSEYNKLWNEKNEISLLETLDKINGKNVKFAISNVITYKGRENYIFRKWMSKYKSVKIKSNYISYHDNSTKTFEEVLVFNY